MIEASQNSAEVTADGPNQINFMEADFSFRARHKKILLMKATIRKEEIDSWARSLRAKLLESAPC